MKRLRLLAMVVVLAVAFGLLGQTKVAKSQSQFLGNIYYGSQPPAGFSQYWNQVTPENSGKWGSVETSRDQYSWGDLDSAYNYAKSNGYPFKHHTFVWDNQRPGWIDSLPQSEQRAEVEEWIHDVCQRYPDIDMIDVVNEPLHAAPTTYMDALGGSGATGWDWVIWSFETAREHCGDAKLLLNDYGILNSSTSTPQYVEIVNLLKDRGLIDGVGVQGHGYESTPLSTLQSNLNQLAATGVPIYLSEYEVDRADDSQQAQIFQEQFPLFWEHPSVAGVTLWGYIQGQIWKSNAYLIRSDGSMRPAMEWLMDYVDDNPNPTPTTGPTATSTATQPTPTATSPTVFAVNSGGSAYTASDGTEYDADTGYSGGYTYSNSASIAGTTDDTLYQSERYGDFTYTVPVPDGDYVVTLHFAETWHPQAGLRSFDVLMEGTERISDLDIYAEAGGNAAYVTQTDVTVNDGELNIEFVTNVENAKVNAIQVSQAGPTPTPTATPTTGPTATPTDEPTATPTPSEATCEVDYVISNDWGSGATISVDVINNAASSVNGWTLEWTFPGNQEITNLWGGSYTQNGAEVDVTNASWNATIPANGGSVNFGFNIAYSGSNEVPGQFVLNGVVCGDEPVPTPTPTTEPPTPTPTEEGPTPTPTTEPPTPTPTTEPPTPTPTPIPPTIFAVNSGGSAYTASDGTEYDADTGYSGGSTYSSSASIDGTTDDTLYQSERYGDFTYTATVPDGYYLVTLHFAETYHTQAGLRSFDVLMEGTERISDLDIYAEVGGNAAYVAETYVAVSDGALDIEFVTNVENAKVNAIQVSLAGPAAVIDYSPANPTEGQVVSFDGSASSDPNGTITSYAWNFGDGSTGTGMMTSHSYAAAGDYEVTLTITDNDNNTGSTTETVTVYSGDPVAEFSISPANPKPGDTVTVDASDSFDPDGTITSYAWNFGDGSTASGVVATHTYASEGDYTITLTVTDDDNRTDSLAKPIAVQNVAAKPRVINTTDIGADPDDQQSMVRQLAMSNDYDLEGLIATTGCWRKSQTSTGMIDTIVDAYAQAYPNLQVHDEDYPSPEYIRSITVLGQTGYGMGDVGAGRDSAGSELIIAAVDKDDPRPVWATCWGGCNTIAQALWKVQNTRSPAEVDEFVSKLRVYDVLGQDNAGTWIAKTFPDIIYIRAKDLVYAWQPSDSWVDQNVQSHGPLGSVYPDRVWAFEGDTPSFLHVYPNGLHDPDQVDQGGWGGRFGPNKVSGVRGMSCMSGEDAAYDPYYMYSDAAEGGDSTSRWSTAIHNDFAARMDWSITSNYAGANHHPIAVVNGDTTKQVLEVSASAGSSVALSAAGSSDPDSDGLVYSWYFYDEPSSYNGSVTIQNSSSSAVTVQVPSNAGGQDIHVILELSDTGSPSLTVYRRVIINVQ